jgi:hypothetical protein
VDCTTNTVTEPRQALVDQLTRSWVRATPGRLESMRWDPAGGVLSARGSGARRGARLVAFWPSRLHGVPRATGAGLKKLRTRPAWGGRYVLATAAGGDWSLEVAPGGLGGRPGAR